MEADSSPPTNHTGPPEIDTSVPHSARIWNYWMGGKDNYPVDREAGDRYKEVYPGIVHMARASRVYLIRVVTYLAREAGVRQFLDIGTGMPTHNNTHEVAQSVAPESRVVYVDNDPLVLAHARALLVGSPEGRTTYVDADIRDPDRILATAAETLDFDQPIALMLMGILGHIEDYEEVLSIVKRLVDALPSGSYFANYDSTSTNEALLQAQKGYDDGGSVPYVLRSPEQVERYYDGLDVLEPGIVSIPYWRPELDGVEDPRHVDAYGGVALKP